MTEALEITTLKLSGRRTGADFVAANEDINAYLRRQRGFRWRRITANPDGTIIDIVAWDTVNDAESSARGIMTEMAGSPVHGMIEQSTVEYQIVPVLQHVAP